MKIANQFANTGEDSMKTITISAVIALIVIVVGVGAFFVGDNYGQQQAQNIRNDFLRARQGGQGVANGVPGQPGQTGQPAGQGGVLSRSVPSRALPATR
jgi:hypothetical protein